MLIPDEINDDLLEILGMVPWSTGPIAHVMRADGAPIRRKMEDEQAFVLHRLLALYAQHGAEWRPAAATWLQEMRARVRAAKATSEATSGREGPNT